MLHLLRYVERAVGRAYHYPTAYRQIYLVPVRRSPIILRASHLSDLQKAQQVLLPTI